MVIAAGARLGPYEILAPLGAGGMGEVYRARDTRVDRAVALKVLPEDFLEGKEGGERKERFAREARALASLNHPNVATLYSFEGIPGSSLSPPSASPFHILVMELLEGSTLREAARGEPLDARALLDYGLQIAEGLAAAHAKGIVHRDLKPENLFVTSEGRVKILDFGLARAAGPASGVRTESVTEALTEAGHVFGTVPYMAPEQLRGERADARSDLFSFGAVLYELASGHRPFAGSSSAEVVSAILREDPRPLDALRPDLPRAFRLLVSQCLEKDPAGRPQSAVEVRDRLRGIAEALRAGAGSRAAVSPGAGRPVRWALVAIGAVLAVFAAILLPRLRAPAPERAAAVRSIAVLPFDNLAKDASQDYFVDGMHEALITDLAKLGTVRVTSRTSVMRYRGQAKPLKEIASELGVDALIEGSILRAGNRVRITAQLVRGATDEHLWAERYDRDLENVLQLLTDVSRAIAGEVRLRVAGGAGPALPPAPSPASKVRPEAWEACLKGRQVIHGFTRLSRADLDQARALFQSAADLDPSLSRAWSGLAMTNFLLGFFRLEPPAEAMPVARAAAERAVALDESSGEALGMLGTHDLYVGWNFDLAGRRLEKAVVLAPHAFLVRHSWADWLMATGRLEESADQMRIARADEPTSSLAAATFLFHLLAARRFDEVIEEGHRVQAAFPQLTMAYSTAGDAYWMKGRHQDSVAEYRKLPGINAEEIDAFEANLKRDGPRAAMRADAERLAARYQPGRGNPVRVASTFANAGDRDRTFEWLEKAFEQRTPQILHVPGDPSFDAVKDDPRYGALLRRIGIPTAPPAR